MRRPLTVLLVAVFVAGCTAVPPSAAPTAQLPAIGAAAAAAPSQPETTAGSAATLAGRLTLAQLIGQKLVVRMEGTTPSADLLGRIRRGEVGGVILFGANITTKTALIALTHSLRAAARAGGQPPLLIAVDQEGGTIKRIPWAPPTLSPPQMGRLGKTSVARAQGASTGTALLGLGIDVDFAPVADVPSSTSSFLYKQGRTFSFNSTTTAALSDAFAGGLTSAGVVPSMKHFPGLGRATANTDRYVVTIKASATTLAPGLRPYRTAIGHDIPMIMLSNATYTAYDSHNAAGWSHAISVDLLRGDMAFNGVTITDSLDGAAAARGLPTWQLAVRAANGGTDMILTTGSEATTKTVYNKLLALARGGFIPRSTLVDSYDRILALKAGL